MITEIFIRFFESYFGFHPRDFVYYHTEDGSITPLPLSGYGIWVITFVYLLSIYTLQKVMKNREPISLKGLFIFHNLILSFGSIVLFVLIMENIIPVILDKGLHFSICDGSIFENGILECAYYINYWFKFYELFDTLFLVLSKKPVQFLHWYHHSLTAVLCHLQLQGNTAVQWVPMSVNLFVHIFMYYYYARVSMGANIWWKKYMTTLQITQFLIDLAAVYYCTFYRLGQTYYPELTGGVTCHGTEGAAIFGCALLSSYLLLFIQFFQKTYSNKASAGKKKSS